MPLAETELQMINRLLEEAEEMVTLQTDLLERLRAIHFPYGSVLETLQLYRSEVEAHRDSLSRYPGAGGV